MSYDAKCEDLARLFLTDTDTRQWADEKHIAELAQQIQDVIESFIEVQQPQELAQCPTTS